MGRALTLKQRGRVHGDAGRDVMIWDAGEHFAAGEAHAAVAIRRLRALGYGVIGIRTFSKAWGQPLITEFDVTLPEEERRRTSQQIKRGMARARAEGTHIGRPRGRGQNPPPPDQLRPQDVAGEPALAAARRRWSWKARARHGYYGAALMDDRVSRVTRPKPSPEQRAQKIARIRAALARAKANGTRLGRPGVDTERVKQIGALLAEGLSLRAIAATVHVGRGTVARIRANTRPSVHPE